MRVILKFVSTGDANRRATPSVLLCTQLHFSTCRYDLRILPSGRTLKYIDQTQLTTRREVQVRWKGAPAMLLEACVLELKDLISAHLSDPGNLDLIEDLRDVVTSFNETHLMA